MTTHPDDLPNALRPPMPTPPEVEEAVKAIQAFSLTDVPQISEVVFKAALLPALSAEPGTKVDLTAWLDIAGTTLRAIDVVAPNGEVLFRVPALMRSLPTAHQSDVNYYDIVHESLLQENVHPNLGQRTLDRQLQRVRTGATLLDVETAKQWNVIRMRYGLPLLPIPGESAGGLPTAADGSTVGPLGVTEQQEDF